MQLFLTCPRLFGRQSFQDSIMEWVRVGQGSKLLHRFGFLATGRLAAPFPEMGTMWESGRVSLGTRLASPVLDITVLLKSH